MPSAPNRRRSTFACAAEPSRRGVVKSKHVGGVGPDNTKGKVDGVHQRIAVKDDIPVGKRTSAQTSL